MHGLVLNGDLALDAVSPRIAVDTRDLFSHRQKGRLIHVDPPVRNRNTFAVLRGVGVQGTRSLADSRKQLDPQGMTLRYVDEKRERWEHNK